MPFLTPVKWGKDRKQAFSRWISDQLQQTRGDRSELERKWSNSIIQWRSQLPEGELDFPYPGAANYEFPLTAIHSDPVYADMMQTLHAPEDYWTPQAKRPDRVNHVTPLREGMGLLERRFLKMKRVNRRALLDNNILGTAVYKSHWLSESKSKKRYRRDGTIEKVVRRLSQPLVEHIPLQRFYFPAEAWTLDPEAPGGASWKAEEFFRTPQELKALAEGSDELPGYDRDALQRVIKFVTDEIPDVDREIQEEDKYKPFEHIRVRLYEVWAEFDVDGDDITETVVAIVHPETLDVLRALHNPHFHGRDPFHVTNYLPSFGVYGIGIAEIDEWAQEGMTKLFNAQIDNALLANTRMFSAPLGSNIQPGEPVYPGKIWFVGPNEKVGEIRMSDVYPSLPTTMSQFMQFAEMRTGVSEIRQGNLTGLPSRTPATSLLSILREGNKRFDMILNGIREVHSEMGLRQLQLVAQHAQEDPLKWLSFFQQGLGEKDAQRVMEVLQEPVESIEESLGIGVTATSAQVNKEVEKQSFVGMLQIAGQIYGSLVQTAMLMAQVPDPTVQATAAASYSSGVDLLQRLLERFDVQNIDEHMGNLKAISESLQAQQAGGNAATQGLMGPQQLGLLGGSGGIPPQMAQALGML